MPCWSTWPRPASTTAPPSWAWTTGAGRFCAVLPARSAVTIGGCRLRHGFARRRPVRRSETGCAGSIAPRWGSHLTRACRGGWFAVARSGRVRWCSTTMPGPTNTIAPTSAGAGRGPRRGGHLGPDRVLARGSRKPPQSGTARPRWCRTSWSPGRCWCAATGPRGRPGNPSVQPRPPSPAGAATAGAGPGCRRRTSRRRRARARSGRTR